MGEGAGILILEQLGHALARGAHIYGEILSQAVTSDAYHMTSPDPEARQIVRAMRTAIERAGLSPLDIDYVNAHGTSTPANDRTESFALQTLLGSRAGLVPVSSTKSMTGHLLGAAGAMETVACMLTIKNRLIYPTINYGTFDPECPLDYVPNAARASEVRYILKNSFGFGGHNVCIVLGRYAS
jgi:3-oxoacyl-[acyl-carrier-protein] synthase II